MLQRRAAGEAEGPPQVEGGPLLSALGARRRSKGRRPWMGDGGSRGRRGSWIRQGRPERFRPCHPEGRNEVKDPGGRAGEG